MMDKQTVWVDVARCTGCGTCVEMCPVEAIALVDGKARVDEGRCIGCGLCVTTCPNDALVLRPRPSEQADRLYENMAEFVEDLVS